MQDARVIPEDLASCQRLLQEAWSTAVELTDTCTTLQGNQEKLQQENEELQATVNHLLRQLYGRRSERLVEGEGQRHFDFGDDDASDPTIVSAAHDDPVVQQYLVRRRRGRKPRNEKLPDHLERITRRFEPELPPGVQLADCTLIGLDVVEVMEYRRGKPWVRRFEYPKYKVPAVAATSTASPLASASGIVEVDLVSDGLFVYPAESSPTEAIHEDGSAANSGHAATSMKSSQLLPEEEPNSKTLPASTEERTRVVSPIDAHGIIQAPREPTLIEGGHYGFSVGAEVLFNKFGMHVPLYRQQDSLAQSGWSPSRSTLGLIVTNCAALLSPLVALMRDRVLATDILGTDDTPVTLLTPREGDGSREARFWLYRGRDAAPYDVFAFTDSRTRDGPDQFLASFRGILSGDCYSGYVNIEEVTGGRIKFSACLGHARRYVFKAREQQPVLASQMLAQFRMLYDIEDRARTMEDVYRLELRRRESVPVMARLRELLDSEPAKRVLPRTKFGEALGYLRNHWSAFQVYLEDGRLPIDNNDVERDLRRIAVGRSNWLFVGSEPAGHRTATIFSAVASAHRHDLDVWEYLCDSLEKLGRGRAAAGGDVTKIDRAIVELLLPDVWAKSHPESIRNFRVDEKRQRAEARRFARAERRRLRG